MTDPVTTIAMMTPPVLGAILGAALGITIDNTLFKNSWNYARFSAMYFILVLIGIYTGAEVSYAIWGKQ